MAKKAKEKEIKYIKNGKRLDGRKVDELREIKIDAGVLGRADGSAYVEWGQNKILAGVFGPREALPKHTQNPYRAFVSYTYRMATFSVPDRKNPRPARREIEISKVSAEALEGAIFLERFPNTEIDVFVEVIDSNAGTRAAALTAAAVALADAGIPMKDLVSSCGVGTVSGTVMLDLTKDEEDAEDAVDIPVAVMPKTEEIVLLQMDGLLKRKEWDSAIELAIKGCKQVYEIQKEALRKRYLGAEKEAEKESAKEGTKEEGGSGKK